MAQIFFGGGECCPIYLMLAVVRNRKPVFKSGFWIWLAHSTERYSKCQVINIKESERKETRGQCYSPVISAVVPVLYMWKVKGCFDVLRILPGSCV